MKKATLIIAACLCILTGCSTNVNTAEQTTAATTTGTTKQGDVIRSASQAEDAVRNSSSVKSRIKSYAQNQMNEPDSMRFTDFSTKEGHGWYDVKAYGEVFGYNYGNFKSYKFSIECQVDMETGKVTTDDVSLY